MVRLSFLFRMRYSVSLFVLAGAASDVGALDPIRVSEDGSGFVRGDSGKPFVVWGVNYDHIEDGRLIEDYWEEDWKRVEEDFEEIHALGANVVRIHLQLGKFMRSEVDADATQLERLKNLLELAEEKELYLDLTGLGCYRKAEVPEWYDALDESPRWEVQERFWEAVASECRDSPAVFCFDLMNEPILAAPKEGEREWLAGELGGFHFVQRLTLDLGGRTQKEVAEAWTRRMVDAIRKHDQRHLVTVGVIPWVHVFPGAKPLFYSPEVSRHLDFVSVHFYPKSGEVDSALTALEAYAIGKPVVVEEMFPLHCSTEELLEFVDRSRPIADGWVSFYWGTSPTEYAEKKDLGSAIKAQWLNQFQKKGEEIECR